MPGTMLDRPPRVVLTKTSYTDGAHSRLKALISDLSAVSHSCTSLNIVQEDVMEFSSLKGQSPTKSAMMLSVSPPPPTTSHGRQQQQQHTISAALHAGRSAAASFSQIGGASTNSTAERFPYAALLNEIQAGLCQIMRPHKLPGGRKGSQSQSGAHSPVPSPTYVWVEAPLSASRSSTRISPRPSASAQPSPAASQCDCRAEQQLQADAYSVNNTAEPFPFSSPAAGRRVSKRSNSVGSGHSPSRRFGGSFRSKCAQLFRTSSGSDAHTAKPKWSTSDTAVDSYVSTPPPTAASHMMGACQCACAACGSSASATDAASTCSSSADPAQQQQQQQPQQEQGGDLLEHNDCCQTQQVFFPSSPTPTTATTSSYTSSKPTVLCTNGREIVDWLGKFAERHPLLSQKSQEKQVTRDNLVQLGSKLIAFGIIVPVTPGKSSSGGNAGVSVFRDDSHALYYVTPLTVNHPFDTVSPGREILIARATNPTTCAAGVRCSNAGVQDSHSPRMGNPGSAPSLCVHGLAGNAQCSPCLRVSRSRSSPAISTPSSRRGVSSSPFNNAGPAPGSVVTVTVQHAPRDHVVHTATTASVGTSSPLVTGSAAKASSSGQGKKEGSSSGTSEVIAIIESPPSRPRSRSISSRFFSFGGGKQQ